ncbi:MAG: hypothetical protein AAFQ95_03310 [Cyanobacteria bacterium J06621_3]
MTYPLSPEEKNKETTGEAASEITKETNSSSYRRRIIYSAKVFGITLRLFGAVLLVVQIVQAVMNISAGSGISRNITVGCLFAVLLVWAGKRSVIEKAVARFAARIGQSGFSLCIYGFPFLLVAFVLWAKIQIGPVSDEWRYVSSEGSISEYGTAIAYLLVPVFAYPMAKLFRKQNRRLMSSLYYVIIAGTFLVGMEELSWGQRLLGFEPPEFWLENNAQAEFNLHNLELYNSHLNEAFIVVGFLGSSCWIVRRYWQSREAHHNAGDVTSSFGSKLDLSYLFPDWPISSFFYPIFIFLMLPRVTPYGKSGTFFHGADQEHWEFIMSLGVLLFVVVSFFRQARAHDIAKQSSAPPSI